MNYYIQGDAANADKIKAAFEKLGINVLDFGFADKTLVYCSIGGCVVQSLPYSINLMHILYSHPDYKELELPVEPKFKVGDKISWINHDCDTQTITDIRDGSYITVDKHGVRCALKFVNQDKWELVPKPHYDISNFYAGMPVLVRADNVCRWDYSVFSRNTGNKYWPFAVCNGFSFTQCIPFNEETKHLLGTNDMCPEEYINW